MPLYPVKCENTGKIYRNANNAAREMFGVNRGSSILRAIRENRLFRKKYRFTFVQIAEGDEPIDKNNTICYVCKNTMIGRCSWFNPDNPVPVKGWTATKKILPVYGGTVVGYIVHKCPNFEKEEWYKWEV